MCRVVVAAQTWRSRELSQADGGSTMNFGSGRWFSVFAIPAPSLPALTAEKKSSPTRFRR